MVESLKKTKKKISPPVVEIFNVCVCVCLYMFVLFIWIFDIIIFFCWGFPSLQWTIALCGEYLIMVNCFLFFFSLFSKLYLINRSFIVCKPKLIKSNADKSQWWMQRSHANSNIRNKSTPVFCTLITNPLCDGFIWIRNNVFGKAFLFAKIIFRN